jgi:hypothetical protein
MRNTVVKVLLSSVLPLLVACAAPDGGSSPPAAEERPEGRAPIESADLLIRESFPPQDALEIVSGLPSGCARFSRIEVTRRDDASIDVEVWNTVPADDDVVCTMIYGTARNTVELGTDFESGRTYEVRVNDEQSLSFTAQ